MPAAEAVGSAIDTTENVVLRIKGVLDEIENQLSQDQVKTALQELPPGVRGPISDGLKQILGLLGPALDELEKASQQVENAQVLLDSTADLMGAVAEIVPEARDTVVNVQAATKLAVDMLEAGQAIAEIPPQIERIIELLDEIFSA